MSPVASNREETAMAVKKVLVVDDSPTERHVLTEMLNKAGYSTIIAESGEQAITVAREQMPDLILMDVVMPGMNGYQATRTITRDEATRHIPVIMCTSKGQETDRIWGMRQGAHDYIVKPIDANTLLAKIAAIG
jgi:twitching motility two-component system response regulator PilH